MIVYHPVQVEEAAPAGDLSAVVVYAPAAVPALVGVEPGVGNLDGAPQVGVNPTAVGVRPILVEPAAVHVQGRTVRQVGTTPSPGHRTVRPVFLHQGPVLERGARAAGEIETASAVQRRVRHHLAGVDDHLGTYADGRDATPVVAAHHRAVPFDPRLIDCAEYRPGPQVDPRPLDPPLVALDQRVAGGHTGPAFHIDAPAIVPVVVQDLGPEQVRRGTDYTQPPVVIVLYGRVYRIQDAAACH